MAKTMTDTLAQVLNRARAIEDLTDRLPFFTIMLGGEDISLRAWLRSEAESIAEEVTKVMTALNDRY